MSRSVGFALSDFVLNHQVCNCCQKYLSVTPVKVYCNGKIKCGRCSKNSEEEENGTESLYNKIAERSIFKCVNRFDGCMRLLRSSEVIEHELTCIPKKYTCPICVQEIFSYLMISHFKLYHSKSLLDTPSFIVNDIINSRLHYLYQLDNHLFFVSLSDVSDPSEEDGSFREFSLNLSPFGDDSFVKSFKANFIHFDDDYNEHVFSKCIAYPMACIVDLNVICNSTLAVNFYVEIEEPNGGINNITQNIIKHEDLNPAKNSSSTCNKNNLIICKNNESNDIHKLFKDAYGNILKILCSQQRNIFPNEAFTKSVSDLSISERATMSFTKSDKKYTITFACKFCSLIDPCFLIPLDTKAARKVCFSGDSNHYYLNCHHCKNLKREQEIMTINELNNISFFCIWDCCQYFQYTSLYQHERRCENQMQQKCPLKSCFHYGKLLELANHFATQHPTIFFQQYQNNNLFCDINLKISQKPVEHILLLWCICVHVKFEWKQPFWEFTVSHEIPDAQIKAMITNGEEEVISSITTSGSFRHCEKIRVRLFLTNL